MVVVNDLRRGLVGRQSGVCGDDLEMFWKVLRMDWSDWDYWFVAVKRVRPPAELRRRPALPPI
jgi:hypothetical protein